MQFSSLSSFFCIPSWNVCEVWPHLEKNKLLGLLGVISIDNEEYGLGPTNRPYLNWYRPLSELTTTDNSLIWIFTDVFLHFQSSAQTKTKIMLNLSTYPSFRYPMWFAKICYFGGDITPWLSFSEDSSWISPRSELESNVESRLGVRIYSSSWTTWLCLHIKTVELLLVIEH